MYNQYVDYNRFFVAGANGHSANAKAYVRYENSYIDNGQGYLAEWGDNGYVYFSGVSFGKGTKQQHRYNGTVKSGIPQAETFNPSYSFEKRNVEDLPKEIPNLSGVGGRYGKMPEYNQGFGQSNKAASVTLTAPAAGAKITASADVTLKADAKDNDGSVKSVAFYVGNTLVGTATASPYQVTAKNQPVSARASAGSPEAFSAPVLPDSHHSAAAMPARNSTSSQLTGALGAGRPEHRWGL